MARDIELMVGPFNKGGRPPKNKDTTPASRTSNHDRFGASHQLLLGYEGSMRLVECTANALIESKERRYA